jgi:hypothetical protein
MTAQPIETDTHVDIAAMVGEMEALPCEHSQHGTGHPNHNDGPATHYILPTHGCAPHMQAYPACGRMIAFIQSGRFNHCGTCGGVGLASDMWTVLGPVNL